MATSLRIPFPHLSLHPHPSTTRPHPPALTIRCGPRSNRGPLIKGRILSIEAIHAVQTLKLSHHKSTTPNHQLTTTLSRLLKSDLLAVLNELIRQNHVQLSLRVFSVVRSEPWYSPDLALYASLVRALAQNSLHEEIDRLIAELEESGSGCLDLGDGKSLTRLIRAVDEANRKEAMVRVYGMMKREGWGEEGSGVDVDEYVAKVLARGFRKLGEIQLAEEVESAYESYSRACLHRAGAY